MRRINVGPLLRGFRQSGIPISFSRHGRGAGVGRGLGVGEGLGVGVGVGVGVAVGVGVGLEAEESWNLPTA
jgi:hypothetical protein